MSTNANSQFSFHATAAALAAGLGVLVLSSTAVSQQQPSLTFIAGNPTAGTPTPVVADIDGDGWEDLAFSSLFSLEEELMADTDSVIYWHLSDTDRSSTTAQVIDLPGASTARLGDLDQDGKADLAATFEGLGASTVLRIYFSITDGLTAPALELPIPGYSGVSIRAIADMDGDADQDLFLVRRNTGEVITLEQTGNGIFGTPITLGSLPGSSLPQGPAVWDLDSDGVTDTIWMRSGKSYISMGMMGQQPLPPCESPGVANTGPTDFPIIIADVNTDGIPDICRLDRISYGNGSAGCSGFDPWESLGFSCVSAADLDGDGDTDLLKYNGAALNPSDGSPPSSWPEFPLAYEPFSHIAAVDQDLDGLLDLAWTANGPACSPGVGPRNGLIVKFGPILTSTHLPVAIDLHKAAEDPCIGDMNGDGIPDVVSVLNCAPSWAVVCQQIGPNGESLGIWELAWGTNPGSAAPPRRLSLIDLNKDGLMDVLLETPNAAHWIINTGQPWKFFRQDLSALPYNWARILDLDNDGHLDIATADAGQCKILFSTAGAGPGVPPATLTIPDDSFTSRSAAFGDFSGNGLKDIAYGFESGQVLFREQIAPRTFAPPTPLLVTGPAPQSLHSADINSDGKDDILFSHAGYIFWRQRLGPLAFAPAQVLGSSASPSDNTNPEFVQFADADGDGSGDLLVKINSSYTPLHWLPSPLALAPSVAVPVHDASVFWSDGVSSYGLTFKTENGDILGMPLDGPVDCNGNGVSDMIEISGDSSLDFNGDGSLDVCIPANYCTSTLNSSGQAGHMNLAGSPELSTNNLTLGADQLPPGQFSYFIMASTTGFVPLFAGSQGNLCVGTPLYRFNRLSLGEIGPSSGTGDRFLTIDYANLPSGVVFQTGATWHFQLWFRDFNPNLTSNTTDGISVMFR